MLILTRKPGEVIMIGDHIKVVIKDIDGGHVRLGIDAPRNIQVDREEIRARKDAEEVNGNR